MLIRHQKLIQLREDNADGCIIRNITPFELDFM